MKSTKKTDIIPLQFVNSAKKEENTLQPVDKAQPYIGKWEDAHEFTRDNEYVKKGYRVNFNSVKRILRSLFMIHNESMNVWSHLCGVLLFITFVAYIAVWISPSFNFPSFELVKTQLGITVDKSDLESYKNTSMARYGTQQLRADPSAESNNITFVLEDQSDIVA